MSKATTKMSYFTNEISKATTKISQSGHFTSKILRRHVPSQPTLPTWARHPWLYQQGNSLGIGRRKRPIKLEPVTLLKTQQHISLPFSKYFFDGLYFAWLAFQYYKLRVRNNYFEHQKFDVEI